jgi:hypothetical protein
VWIDRTVLSPPRSRGSRSGSSAHG